MLLQHKLDVIGHDPAFLLPRAEVPKDDGQVVGTRSEDVSVPDVLGRCDVATVACNWPDKLQFFGVVYFEFFQVSLHH